MYVHVLYVKKKLSNYDYKLILSSVRSSVTNQINYGQLSEAEVHCR